MRVGDQETVLFHLTRARAQVEVAREAVAAGDHFRAAACLNEARALQREAVAALMTGCWQDVLARAGDSKRQYREEALDHLVQLASAVLGTLCRECRQKVSVRLQTGEGS